MGIISKSLKWSIKLGTAGGSVYVAHQYKIFGPADQAENSLQNLQNDGKTAIPGYIPKEVLENVPEMPEIPTVDIKDMIPELPDLKPDIRGLWNRGVMATFTGIANSPTLVKTYSNDLVVFLQEQMNDNK